MDFSVIEAWVLARIKEPSTWSGLVSMATAVGVVFNPHQAAMIIAGGVGLAGFISAVSSDPKNIVADVEAAVNDIVLPVIAAKDAPVANTITK